MKALVLPLLALVAGPALASSAPRILDCSFSTECASYEGACTDAEAPFIEFALIVAIEGDRAGYEGDVRGSPMLVHYTEDGILHVWDPEGPTLTTVGSDGTAVHASNLLLPGGVIRAAQWTGACVDRE